MTTLHDWSKIEKTVYYHGLITVDGILPYWECICGHNWGRESTIAKREHDNHLRSLIIQSGEQTNGN